MSKIKQDESNINLARFMPDIVANRNNLLQEKSNMIRHIILFKVKPHAPVSKINQIWIEMRELKNKLPGIITSAGSQIYPFAEKSPIDFSHAITIDFTDITARDTFFCHSASHPFKDAIVAVTEGGYEKIVGFDLKI